MNFQINIKGLSKHFGNNVVLDGVDLQITAETITAVIGKSGTGKSVLLKLIAGILEKNSGTIEFTKLLESGEVIPISFNDIGFSYMFQNNALFDSMTAFENVALPLIEGNNPLPNEKIKEKVNHLLEQLDIIDSRNRYPGELSGGMNKRIAFARALVTEPKVVLFDEPTTGLHFHDIQKLLTSLNALVDNGHSVLVIEHNLEVVKTADWIIDLGPEGGDKGGNIVFAGLPEDLVKCKESVTGKYLKEKI